MHHSRLCAVLVDCNVTDLDEAARFWAEALGRPVDRSHPMSRGNYRMLETPPDEPIVEIQRVEQAPRGPWSGAGLKPLQAAIVKSDRGERCSKRRDEIPSGVIWRGERKRTADEVSKCHRRCQNRGLIQLPGSARERS